MESKLNDLFNTLNVNVKNENKLLQFCCNRLILEITNMFNHYQINCNNYDLSNLLKEHIYNECKNEHIFYINSINSIHNTLSKFIIEVEKNGTNLLECEKEAKKYHENISKLNIEITYQNEFNNFKNKLLAITNLYNQQINLEINKILNKNQLELETEIIKLRQENNKIFNQIEEEITKYGITHNTKPVNPAGQAEIIKNNLVNLNNSKINQIKQKIEKIFDYSSNELGTRLEPLLKTNYNKEQFYSMMFNIFTEQYNASSPVFYQGLNNNFIDYMINRTMQQLSINPKFEISRDKNIFDYSKEILENINLINVDLVFANIESILSDKYDMKATNPNYLKILNIMNTIKATTETLVKKTENEIMLSNIIEMQSQILMMHL